jgi:hypothetical protein
MRVAEGSSVAMQFDEVLRTFSRFFEDEGIRYALIGGLAVHAWGYSRATQDIDFVVDGSNRSRAIAFAESLGYETTYQSPGFSNHYHRTESFGHIDFMYVYDRTAEQVFAEATTRFAIENLAAPVASAEHVIAMKVTAMKDSPHRVLGDSRDVAFLLALPHIDRKRVRNYFEQAGLLKMYDDLENERAGR